MSPLIVAKAAMKIGVQNHSAKNNLPIRSADELFPLRAYRFDVKVHGSGHALAVRCDRGLFEIVPRIEIRDEPGLFRLPAERTCSEANVATSSDWQQSAKRLVDILITGSRPTN
jgi:hypothetical protein